VNRRTQGVLIISSLVVAAVVVVAMVLASGLVRQHCATGFPTVISGKFEW
jgi:hypothetical protein